MQKQQNLFSQHVSGAAKLWNVCLRNNVSWFSQTLRRLFHVILFKLGSLTSEQQSLRGWVRNF